MKKSLILNFHSGANFINTCAFIDQFKADNPHTQIFMLTGSDNEDSTRLINHIEGFFFIDQSEIRNCWNTPIFNQDISLNLFINKIRTLLKIKWQSVINVSNNNFAAYLASSFQAESYIGTFINDQHHVQYSDHFFETTNEVIIPKNIPTPLTLRLAKSFNLKSSVMSFNRVEEFDKITSDKFNKIKLTAPEKSMIGLDIVSLTRALGANTAHQIIQHLSSQNEVFLIAEQTSEAISAINNLHHETQNVYKSITCNALTFASIANCISDFYTCDGIFGAIAANSGVQTYFISNSYNSRLLQSLAPNSCVITANDALTVNFSKIELSQVFNITSSETYAKLALDNIEYYHADFIETRDNKVASSLAQTLGYKLNFNLEKNYLTTTVRYTLSALRSLKTEIRTSTNANNFVEAISSIFESAEGTSLASLAACTFKSRIENNTFENVSDNIDYIEKELFSLKNQLKQIATYLENSITNKQTGLNSEV
jgi:hypothetical protein